MTTSTDGRVARRQKNRAATLDAVLELFGSGSTDPTVEDISEWSGVSTRSIYRYFHHRERLLRAALEHLRLRLEPQLRLLPDPARPIADRIARFSEHRLALHQALAPLTRATRRAVVAGADESVTAGAEPDVPATPETHLRTELEAQFAPELERYAGLDREVCLAALGLAFGFDAIEHLQRTLPSDSAVIAVFARHLSVHLAAPPAAPAGAAPTPSAESQSGLTANNP